MFITNNRTQWQFLKQLVVNERVPHALIFSGPSYLPKKETALNFVKLLNCQDDNLENRPCAHCFSCSLFKNNKHPDIIFIGPEKKEISISEIRNLQKRLSFRPQLGNFKTAIIEEAECLNREAQNCFLKTLEEPKGRTLLILLTSSLGGLLETVRSRCQLLKFYPHSFYFPGSENFTLIEKILNFGLGEKLSFCQKFFNKELSFQELDYFLESFLNYLRAAMLQKIGLENEALAVFSLNIPKNYSLLETKKALEYVSDLRSLLASTNINQRLAFENMIIQLAEVQPPRGG